MSLHSSLKTKSGALNQHRNVLTRAERIAKLLDQGDYVEGESSPLGIPKVRSIKVAAAKKKKAKAAPGEGDEAEAVEAS
ncbi:MAG: small basic protein [Phycisphaerales bacterium]|nr:small basic protein [Phycisphaerales bacterium]